MRKFLIILIAFLSISAVVIYFGSQWAEHKIEQEIVSIPFLSFDSLDIDVIDRSFKLYNLTGVKDRYNGSIEFLEIQGLELFSILNSKRFIIDHVTVEGVNLSYQMGKSKKNDTTTSNTIDIPEFKIQQIDVRDTEFTILGKSGNKMFSTQLNATLEDFISEDLSKPGNIPSKLEQLVSDSARFYTSDGLYTVDLAKIVYRDRALVVKKFSLQSEKEKEEIGRYIGHEIDWFNARADSIVIEIKNPGTLLKKPQIQTVDIFSPNVDVFRDKRLPSRKNHYPLLLRHVLADEDFAFAFDTIRIHDGKVVYEEFVKEERGPGKASFHRINADILNMKSYSFGLTDRPRVVASCYIYDEAELFVDASFPIDKQSENTLVKGKLMPVDLTLFNRMISYVSVVEIKSGYSNMLEFDFTYTDQKATGEMKFAYNDLAISFLEKQESKPDGVVNSVKSFFVNSFVIDSDNDFESSKFRMGKIDFDRERNKSIFNYWFGSVISGFKSSTGVNASGEKIDTN